MHLFRPPPMTGCIWWCAARTGRAGAESSTAPARGDVCRSHHQRPALSALCPGRRANGRHGAGNRTGFRNSRRGVGATAQRSGIVSGRDPRTAGAGKSRTSGRALADRVYLRGGRIRGSTGDYAIRWLASLACSSCVSKPARLTVERFFSATGISKVDCQSASVSCASFPSAV